jgi:hypothetical protein
MNETLWKLPVPASALIRAPTFLAMGQRRCKLTCYIEADSGEKEISLLFEGVEAFKCTYLTSCTPSMMNVAYGKLVKLETTPWLEKVMKLHSNTPGATKDLKHLIICFDDGPCYEIICSGITVV